MVCFNFWISSAFSLTAPAKRFDELYYLKILILKTNIKGYLTDILIEKGYNISYNDIYTKPENNTLNKETLQKKIKENMRQQWLYL